jgi:hypothetical protein
MNKKYVELTWQCKECKDIVVSYSNRRHDMNFCKCGKSAIDLEENYQRGMGNIKVISKKVKKG